MKFMLKYCNDDDSKFIGFTFDIRVSRVCVIQLLLELKLVMDILPIQMIFS